MNTSIIIGSLTLIFTIIALGFAIYKHKKDIKESKKAKLIARRIENLNFMKIEIRNIGNSVAKNINFEFPDTDVKYSFNGSKGLEIQPQYNEILALSSTQNMKNSQFPSSISIILKWEDEYSKKREMLKLPDATFKAFNADTSGIVNYIEFDREIGVVSYYGKNDTLLFTALLNPNESKWLSVDPMSDKYPNSSPYVYVANNPIRLIDPNGMTWVDADGNQIKDHSNVKVYIFYDPSERRFANAARTMYKEAEAKYGKGSAAMSNVTMMAEFAQDWSDMGGMNISEVNLNYHGGPQTLNLDWSKGQYITATGNGYTPGTATSDPAKATNVSNLPMPAGNINNAQLNINSCESNNASHIKNGTTLAVAFRNTTMFNTIRTTSQGVSYFHWFSPDAPHPQDHSNWQYLPRPTTPTYPGVGLPPR